jgi:aryl-alcohol dehydrogenase-like predicted oxidoreductase
VRDPGRATLRPAGRNLRRKRFLLSSETMEYIDINGAQVSRIGLGTWAIGGSEWGEVAEDDAIRTCLAIFNHGINLIDTAPIYGGRAGHGRAEEIIGKAMAKHGGREEFYIATKCGLDWSGGQVVTNSTPAFIERELEASLKRLGTNYVDLYQVHWPDPLVPMEEVAGLFARLLKSGRIRAIGVSNFSPAQMDAFRKVAPIHTSQPPYNLFERAVEAEVLPYCGDHGIGVFTYSSLCRSLLGGRLRPEMRFDARDVRAEDPKFQPPRFAQYLAAVRRLDALAEQHFGKHVLELAVRWVLDRPGVSVALWGAKRPQQLAPVSRVLDWHLDERALRAIDDIVTQEVTDPVGPEYLTPGLRTPAPV